MKGDNYTLSDMDNQSHIEMDDIVLAYNKIDNIDSMNIEVERDSFRNHPSYRAKRENQESILAEAKLNKSSRDPTVAPPKPITKRSNKEDVKEKPKEIESLSASVDNSKLPPKP